MAQLTVEVTTLAAASRQLSRTVADQVFDAVADRLDPLHQIVGMAGDDPSAQQWAAGYDRAAPLAIIAAQDVINACYRVSSMLAASARNYASAESASTIRGHALDPTIAAAVATLPDDTRIGLPSDVPTARGDTGTLEPEGPDIATVCMGPGDRLQAVAHAFAGGTRTARTAGLDRWHPSRRRCRRAVQFRHRRGADSNCAGGAHRCRRLGCHQHPARLRHRVQAEVAGIGPIAAAAADVRAAPFRPGEVDQLLAAHTSRAPSVDGGRNQSAG